MSKYLHSPIKTKELPRGMPYIISNEAAERFSFYGMKGILVIYMTQYLFLTTGDANISEESAKGYFHLFTSAVYFFPIFGALISDIFFGKYKTIISLSLVYCLGHFILAIEPSELGLSLGLTFIAIGSGGIKPCVSAHLGDQFSKNNSSKERRALIISYGASFFKEICGEEEHLVVVPKQLQENLSPRIKSLIGFGRGIKKGASSTRITRPSHSQF